MAIKISVHTKEETALGKFTSKLPFLSDKEMTELNSIGYSGTTSSGKRITREEYLNSLGKGTFRVVRTKSDSGDFTEEFTIIRAYEE